MNCDADWHEHSNTRSPAIGEPRLLEYRIGCAYGPLTLAEYLWSGEFEKHWVPIQRFGSDSWTIPHRFELIGLGFLLLILSFREGGRWPVSATIPYWYTVVSFIHLLQIRVILDRVGCENWTQVSFYPLMAFIALAIFTAIMAVIYFGSQDPPERVVYVRVQGSDEGEDDEFDDDDDDEDQEEDDEDCSGKMTKVTETVEE